jgi:hypothetical protein
MLALFTIVGIVVFVVLIMGSIKFSEWLDNNIGYPMGAWFAVLLWGIFLMLALIFS